MEPRHDVKEVWVRAFVDVGIADMVEYLQTFPGVCTEASCQGTIGEGGPHPYRAQVLTTWPDEGTYQILAGEFDISHPGYPERYQGQHGWGYLHPKDGWLAPNKGKEIF